jgi:hypothetical protein
MIEMTVTVEGPAIETTVATVPEADLGRRTR